MQSVPELLETRARELGSKVYLEFKDKKYTYSEVNQKATQAARGLMGLGLAPGDRVAVMAGNSPEFIFLWWGILKLGGVLVPVNLNLTPQEAAYIIDHSRSVAAILGEAPSGSIEEIRESSPRVRHWLTLGVEEKTAYPAVDSFFGEQPAEAPWAGARSGMETQAVILYTSGTTGFPKGVVHTHGNYLMTAASFAKTCALKKEDRLLTANPLFHVNAQFYSALGTLWAGATFCLAEKFSASRMWGWTRAHKANKVVMLLALTTILYGRPPHEDDADNPVELVVAGGAPKGCYHNFEKRFGLKLQTLYSLTEAPLAIMSPIEKACVDGAVGLPMSPGWPGLENEVRVVRPDGSPAGTGETGEIAIRNQALFTEYLRDPEATRKARPEGWLHTGDLGLRDEKGWIHFLGRGKDVIRKKGENISAAEVEGVLTAHASVSEAAVIAVHPADAAGEDEVMAFVVQGENAELDWAELAGHCAARLAAFKIPRFWLRVDVLPKNATNRVLKDKLKAGSPPESRPGVFDRMKPEEAKP